MNLTPDAAQYQMHTMLHYLDDCYQSLLLK